MPKQRVGAGVRWSVEDMNIASQQSAQFYANPTARDAAFRGEDPNQRTIVHLSDPPTEDLRWQRYNGTMWIPAALPGDINVGWRNDVVVADRTTTATHKAVIVISRTPEAGETFTVEWSTADDTATVAENDYTAVPWTLVTFNPGDTSKEVEFSVTGKGATQYPAERFHLRLRNPSEGGTGFRLGFEADVLLPPSAPTGGPAPLAPLTLTLADAAATAEADKATIRASINREATGDFTFEYSTRATTRGSSEDAPAGLYAAAASVKATIPEGQTHTDITIQTNEVNAVVNVPTQYFEIVVPQSSLAVAGGDTIATTGHDLVALVPVTRNQYQTPNFFIGFGGSGRDYRSHQLLTSGGTRLIQKGQSGRVGNVTFRNQPTGWPVITIPYDGGPRPGSSVRAEVFYQATFYAVYENAVTPHVFRQVVVEGRLDIPSGLYTGVGEDWHSPLFMRISFMPQPGPGLAAWYSKASYADLQIADPAGANPACRLRITRAVGIKISGAAADAPPRFSDIGVPATFSFNPVS